MATSAGCGQTDAVDTVAARSPTGWDAHRRCTWSAVLLEVSGRVVEGWLTLGRAGAGGEVDEFIRGNEGNLLHGLGIGKAADGPLTLVLNFAFGVDAHLEKFDPTDPTEGVFGEHASDKTLQEGRDGSWEL